MKYIYIHMWYVCVYIYACVCVYVSEKYMFALKCKQEDMYMCMYTTVKINVYKCKC